MQKSKILRKPLNQNGEKRLPEINPNFEARKTSLILIFVESLAVIQPNEKTVNNELLSPKKVLKPKTDLVLLLSLENPCTRTKIPSK